jgi:hypothetical protein
LVEQIVPGTFCDGGRCNVSVFLNYDPDNYPTFQSLQPRRYGILLERFDSLE